MDSQLIQCVGDTTKACEKALDGSRYEFCEIERSSWAWVVPGKTVVSEFDLVCGRAWLSYFVIMIYFLGLSCGGILWYIASENMTRKKLLHLGLLSSGTFGLLCATAPVLWTLFLFRFFLGVAVSVVFVSAFVLSYDTIGVSWRSYSGVFLQGGFIAGAAMLALLTWLIPRWRWITFICGLLPLFLTMTTWSYMVESPLYLLCQGRKGEATSAIAALAFGNYMRPPDCPLADPTGILSNPHRNFIDIVKNKTLRRRTFLQTIVWLAISVVYFSVILLFDDLSSRWALTAGSSPMELAFTGFAYELPGIAVLSLISERVGRKTGVILGLLQCGATLSIASVTKGTTQQAFIVASRFGIGGAVASMFILSWELYPSILVYHGLSYLHLVARFGALSAPWLAFAALQLSSSVVPLIICGALSIAAAITVSLLPETVSSPVPESVQDLNSSLTRGSKSWMHKWLHRGFSPGMGSDPGVKNIQIIDTNV